MDILKKLDLTLISKVCDSRPTADHSVEQYLMTAESMYTQLNLCEEFLSKSKIIFLGDDDHFSILASKIYNTESVVVEIDQRIIKNEEKLVREFNLRNHKIITHDIRTSLKSLKLSKFNGFVANPPYSSKNDAYGIKVWISRALEVLKPKSIGLLILPINFDLSWSIKNMVIVQEFLAINNCMVVKIDNDIHTYEDLPDPNLRSSNIWIYYLGGAKNLIPALPKGTNVYRK